VVHEIENVLENSLEALLNEEAADASCWAASVSVRAVFFSPSDIKFIWIPLSESESLFVVLHLLGQNINLSALNIFKFNSHVSNLLAERSLIDVVG
jgi:hypothetical protein